MQTASPARPLPWVRLLRARPPPSAPASTAPASASLTPPLERGRSTHFSSPSLGPPRPLPSSQPRPPSLFAYSTILATPWPAAPWRSIKPSTPGPHPAHRTPSAPREHLLADPNRHRHLRHLRHSHVLARHPPRRCHKSHRLSRRRQHRNSSNRHRAAAVKQR